MQHKYTREKTIVHMMKAFRVHLVNCHPIGNKPPHDRWWWERNQLDPYPFVQDSHIMEFR